MADDNKSPQYRFPRLEGEGIEKITLLGSLTQITEEVGEFAELIGMLTGVTGKRKHGFASKEQLLECTAEELFDIIQASMSCLYYLRDEEGVDIDVAYANVMLKLLKRGYVSNE